MKIGFVMMKKNHSLTKDLIERMNDEPVLSATFYYYFRFVLALPTHDKRREKNQLHCVYHDSN
jgi:hypothetical protein